METPSGNIIGTPATGFYLLIERGVSRYPQRPIAEGRYLIGAGSNCHLQLGGDIPLLHSIILTEPDGLWMDAVSAFPPLLVNGSPFRDGPISPGDLIEIGEFVFSLGYHPAREVPLPVAPVAVANNEKSAAELLEILDQNLTELNRFESSNRVAAAALSQAAARHETLSTTFWEGDPRAELLRMLEELHERTLDLDRREAALAEHARKLAESQEELRLQLQRLCEQQAIPVSAAGEEHRKSA